VKLLLEHGADPLMTTFDHTSPLMVASGVGWAEGFTFEYSPDETLEVVKLLIAKGADVNARVKEFRPQRRFMMPLGSLAWVDFTGQTSFVRAALSADVPLMKLLLSKGADPNIATFNGTTPLMAATGVNWVVGQTYSESPAMYLEAVKLCLELGGDVNAVDDRGETAMHGAAYNHLPSVAQFLADHGASIEIWNKKNRNNWTPLRIAEGVHRGMNLRRSPETAAVTRKVMTAAGVSTEVEPEAVISGAIK